MHRPLNLKNPRTLNEKLQWMKLYYRVPLLSSLVDKYAVKQIVADKIGENYIIPTLAVYDRIEDIDLEQLPDKFVLKLTNGGGGKGIAICKDKRTFDSQSAFLNLRKYLHRNIYRRWKEWAYRDVPVRIIAEQYIDLSLSAIEDYKFYCFDGMVAIILACTGRANGVQYYYFDREWNFLPTNRSQLKLDSDFTLPRPQHLQVWLYWYIFQS